MGLGIPSWVWSGPGIAGELGQQLLPLAGAAERLLCRGLSESWEFSEGFLPCLPLSCRASPLQKGGLSLAICLGSALLTALCLGARGAVLLSHDLMLGTNLLFPPSLHPFSPKNPLSSLCSDGTAAARGQALPWEPRELPGKAEGRNQA